MRKVIKITASLLALILLVNVAIAQNNENTENLLENVKYIEMTTSEKRKFIENETNKMLGLFRRVDGDELTPKSVENIKRYVDGYLRRASTKSLKGTRCRFGDNLQNVLERGKSIAPTINQSFKEKDIPAQVGIYLAMIESEFCPCIQSPTGSLGMFQLSFYMAKENGLDVKRGANPKKPDGRCEPKKASQAAASYFNSVINNNFGRNSIGFPFSIAAYNAGEGATRRNMKFAQNEAEIEDISFWLMSDIILERNAEKESNESDEANEQSGEFKGTKHFLYENSKYVPKFFSAALIGENPRIFGFEMLPLSQVK